MAVRFNRKLLAVADKLGYPDFGIFQMTIIIVN